MKHLSTLVCAVALLVLTVGVRSESEAADHVEDPIDSDSLPDADSVPKESDAKPLPNAQDDDLDPIPEREPEPEPLPEMPEYVEPEPVPDVCEGLGPDDNLDQAWENFKEVHQRSYASEDEEEDRRKIFEKNARIILEHNAEFENDRISFPLSCNQYTDSPPLFGYGRELELEEEEEEEKDDRDEL